MIAPAADCDRSQQQRGAEAASVCPAEAVSNKGLVAIDYRPQFHTFPIGV
jgi:hypothetical protein